MFLSGVLSRSALTFDFVNKKNEVIMATQFNTSRYSTQLTNTTKNNRYSDVIIVDITGV